MSYTWAQFKAATQECYNPGAQSTDRENAAIAAVANRVKSLIAREVYSDLPLAKSYEDLYLKAKVALGGYVLTSNFATVSAAVATLLTVDGAMGGMSSYNAAQIQNAMDDFDGTATLFNQLLVTAAVEIQRHAPGYRDNQATPYHSGSSGVVVDGFVSRITLSFDGEIKQVLFGDRFEALAANTAYAVDDYVQSNGRVYKCVTAGTSANPLGDGLVSTDSEDETTGTAVFQYYAPLDYRPMKPVAWWDRYRLQQDEPCETGLFTVNDAGTELWVYPAMDSDHDIIVGWSGIKHSFLDADTTTFNQPCAQYAAEFVRGMMEKNVLGDARAASISLSSASALLKRLWMDSSAKR